MRFDWHGLLRLGLKGLRLSPERFWALTPAELMVMLGRDGTGAPLSRHRLEELARAFPDRPEGTPPGERANHPERSDGK